MTRGIRQLTFCILGIAILITQVSADPAQLKVGVKPGNWIKYDYLFIQKWTHPKNFGDNHTETAIFECLIDVLDVEENVITFRKSNVGYDGSLMWNWTYIADPTIPNNEHPEIEVHHFFLPSGLEAGDNVPEVIYFSCNVGEIYASPWSQRINETIMSNVLYNDRLVNWIHWKVENLNELGSMVDEREYVFDKETGIVLSFYQNSTFSFLDEYGRWHTGIEVHEYFIKDTNVWPEPYWMSREMIQVVAVVVIISLFSFIFLTLRGKAPALIVLKSSIIPYINTY
jgi:hypothetical protein